MSKFVCGRGSIRIGSRYGELIERAPDPNWLDLCMEGNRKGGMKRKERGGKGRRGMENWGVASLALAFRGDRRLYIRVV